MPERWNLASKGRSDLSEYALLLYILFPVLENLKANHKFRGLEGLGASCQSSDFMGKYCDVPSSPCLSKNKANQVCNSFFLDFCPPVDGPKDLWSRVLSPPGRFVGDNIIVVFLLLYPVLNRPCFIANLL